MRIVITGHKGQLGQQLLDALQEHTLSGIDLPDVDITDRDALFAAVGHEPPELIIHTAAYTDVDGCERDPQLAYRVNALGTQNVALACLEHDAAMLHVSTNEVFGGERPEGYLEWMAPDPRNAYARSKTAAEFHVRQLLRRAYIVRIAWAYAPGGRNFVHAILRAARQNDAIRVVTDEIGNPTSMRDVAAAIGDLIQTGQFGTYHLVNEGSCSRWAFANEILRLAKRRDAALDHVRNVPILSSDYRRASTPPPYGALHNVAAAALGIRLRPWQEALEEFIGQEIGD